MLIQENPGSRLIVVTLSLQSIASFGAKFDLKFNDAAEKLANFFNELGVDYVFDVSLARHICLIESQKEFASKFEKGEFPVLTSVCPGWVCYVEKTHGELLVPHLSKVKSPQQIMGSIVKQFLYDRDKISPDNIYHVTIMPCYDKKLEATRSEFCETSTNAQDVDCVLTPVEIEILLKNQDVDFSLLSKRKLDSFNSFWETKTLLKNHLGSGSGGYVENVFRFIAEKYFSKNLKNEKLNYKTTRNRDLIELSLEDEQGKKLLSFAVINGFRNIQTLVQRIKRNTCHYQFVEVMACPSGCLNGGAQLRGNNPEEKIYERVENLYKSLETSELSFDSDDNLNSEIYRILIKHESYLHTEFHAIPKNLNLINVNW